MNREVIKPIVEQGCIFEACSDEPWTVNGAAVRVSLICFAMGKVGAAKLDGEPVTRIFSDLSDGSVDVTQSLPLPENAGIAIQGPTKGGKFDVSGGTARQWLLKPLNPNGRSNNEVLRPWVNGEAITGRYNDQWIVDFGQMPFDEACFFEAPFDYVGKEVRPKRQQSARQRRREYWWQYNEPAPGLRKATVALTKFIVTPEVSKHRVFAWLERVWAADKNLVVIAREDDTSFGILHSRFHEYWALRMGTSLEDRPRYTSSTTFRTFPFPEGLTPNIPAADYSADPRARAIAAAAARLNELRENWLNPADLAVRKPEVVPSYPDRILPRDDAAAKELKKRTLTNLYNARPQWLAKAHAALDAAVADAYGWGEDWRAGRLDGDEILARLFALNQSRSTAKK